MRILTGDECGLLKECIPETSRKSTFEDERVDLQYHAQTTLEGVRRLDPREEQTRRRGVVDMAWLPPAGGAEEDDVSSVLDFAVLRSDCSVRFWRGETTKWNRFGSYRELTSKTIPDVFSSAATRPLAMSCHASKRRLCVGDVFGTVAVCPLVDDAEETETSSPKTIHRIHAYGDKNNDNNDNNTLRYTKGKLPNQHLATAMALDVHRDRVAIGGRERETRLLDLDSGRVVWKAKNLPPDPQTLLQHPVWPSSILFFNRDTMVVGTAYGQVRLYDVRIGSSNSRRPVSYTPEGLLEHRITAVCPLDDRFTLAVGDTAGHIHSLDIRKNFGRDTKLSKQGGSCSLGRFAGPAGSIRKMVKHPTLPVLSVVGLDRMLRTYDTNNRKQLDCVYLKQRLTSLLVSPRDGTWAASESGKLPRNNESVIGYDNDGASSEPGSINQEDVVRDYVDSSADESSSSSEEEDENHNAGSHRGSAASDSEDDDAIDDGGKDSDDDSSSEDDDDSDDAGDGSTSDSSSSDRKRKKRRRS